MLLRLYKILIQFSKIYSDFAKNHSTHLAVISLIYNIIYSETDNLPYQYFLYLKKACISQYPS